MAAEAYRKLTGRSLTSVQKSYLGDDHLLVLDGHYRETVKRLRYADIEATLLCPTRTGKVFGIVGALGGAFFAVVAIYSAPAGILWFWLVCVALCFGTTGYNLYHLGTARLGVQTAVQTVILEGASTLRKARRAEERLAERVTAAQGRLEQAALSEALARPPRRGRVRAAVAEPPPIREVGAEAQMDGRGAEA